ncbi:MAG: VWA domain-containing protein [Spirochaetia bacterium]|nr:VWA domain-containing protein [Spirochaetia bacterium]
MRFANMEYLWPAVAAAVIMLAAVVWRSLKYRRVNYSNFAALKKTRHSLNLFYWMPDALKVAAVILLIIGLLRPQSVRKETQEKIKGIDIILALDLSGSMQAQDLKPNRAEAAKKVLKEFVSKLATDRVGLVVFAGKAFSQCPLTIDYEIVNSFIDQMDLKTVRIDGTNIGEAILTGINRLEASTGTKVMILATDGRANTGTNPVESAKIAAYKNIKIYTIGIGKKGGAPRTDEYGRQFYDRFSGQPLTWEEPDEDVLTQVAGVTGGRYFRATNESSLRQIYDIIAKLEKQDIQVKTYNRYEDKFVIFLWIGVALLLLAVGLEAWKFLRVLG